MVQGWLDPGRWGRFYARDLDVEDGVLVQDNGNKSCSEYLQRIQQLCDTLTTTGDAISNREQTDTILDIETMILAYEARLEQPKQTALQESLTLNLAESTLAPCSVPANMPENHVVANYVSTQGAATANSTLFSLNQNQYSSQGNFPVNSDGYGRGQNCGRGAQGCGGQVQCQIYKKRGHEASTCYHRSAVAPFGNFGSPYSFFGPSFSGPSFSQIGSYGFQLQHSFAPPNFGALQVFGNMQQPHFANGTTPTPWMPYLPDSWGLDYVLTLIDGGLLIWSAITWCTWKQRNHCVLRGCFAIDTGETPYFARSSSGIEGFCQNHQ
ncbi:hypothetical protein JHK82_011967 [Glycine max]|nr:hypothetical protein JHK82_011967 [Glycine max]